MSHAVVGRQRRAPRKSTPQPDQPGLTREAIVAAAIRLIDATELESFSMRNLAKELGVYPTAIYWHIPSRSAVIAEVISEVLRDIAPALPLDWKTWLKCLFRNFREAIRQHPNVAPLIGVQLISNASVDLDMIERILAVLTQAGCPPEQLRSACNAVIVTAVGLTTQEFTVAPKEEAAEWAIGMRRILTVLTQAGCPLERLRAAYNAVVAAMVGFTTQEFAMVPKEKAAEWAIGMHSVVASVEADHHPILARNIDGLANKSFILRWQNGAEAPMDDSFELFIDAFITGLETVIDRPRQTSS
ncbi:TetR/AcrR family transcriptional regulator [Bradyrhizobium sp. SZCCHNR1075]|uniref:TetR/AcrR family transcriptional regulator n=1 Tax=Bradyrhizobium sp. SZCCHNR1075 TaxID=3057362 RepID=UPI0028F0A56F|nr:TetR/AcrR family transcriptional regulator C-terminal domain-containing protein [Bradyrhizobium sp. SZCCHNR1075]